MFPFEKKVVLTFNTPELDCQARQELMNRFVVQFDEVKQISTSFSFRNFKTFYRRHKWLNGGQIRFDFQEKRVHIHLQLNFYYMPVLFVFVSVAFIVIHLERIYLGGSLTAVLWLLYGLLYIWTSALFKAAIRNTMRKYASADGLGV